MWPAPSLIERSTASKPPVALRTSHSTCSTVTTACSAHAPAEPVAEPAVCAQRTRTTTGQRRRVGTVSSPQQRWAHATTRLSTTCARSATTTLCTLPQYGPPCGGTTATDRSWPMPSASTQSGAPSCAPEACRPGVVGSVGYGESVSTATVGRGKCQATSRRDFRPCKAPHRRQTVSPCNTQAIRT